jgi:hypothetical protein
MIKKSLILIFILFSTSNIYSFSQVISPSNNSIISDLNQTISGSIFGTENTSTFIDWDSSVVGYWNFDSGNSTHVFDLSSNSNDGEYILGAVSNNSNSIRGNYSDFDGNNDRVLINNIDSIESNSQLSISLWFNSNGLPTNPVDTEGLFSIHDGWSDFIHIRFIPDTQILYARLERGDVGSSINISYSNITINTWYHLVFMFDSGNYSIYLNSELKNSKLNAGPALTPDLVNSINIGSFSDGSHDEFSGKIDEVMIFNRTISEREIKSLYNSQINNFEFNTTELSNLTNYNYNIYSINTSGDLLRESYNFFVNTSYVAPIIPDSSQNIVSLPSLGFGSVLVLFIGLFVFLI